MRRHLLIVPVLIAGLTGAAFAAGHEHAQPAPKAEKPNLTCPVMKGQIPSVAQAAGHSTYHGHTYYFCCGGCKPQFDKDPTRYVDPVCGMVLPKAPKVSADYQGKKYSFCSDACKAKFQHSPAQYLKK